MARPRGVAAAPAATALWADAAEGLAPLYSVFAENAASLAVAAAGYRPFARAACITME